MGIENSSEQRSAKRTARINGLLVDVDALKLAENKFAVRAVSSEELSFFRQHDRGWLTEAGETIGPKQIIDLAESCGANFDVMIECQPSWKEHIDRVRRVDFLTPILVTEALDLIDGAHRITKMFIEKRTEISARIVPTEELKKYQIG